MTITARYPGQCPTCHHAITPGQQIEWIRGARPRHTTCQPRQAAGPVAAAPALRRRPLAGPTKRCWECGCAFTAADARANDGDWADGYCGC